MSELELLSQIRARKSFSSFVGTISVLGDDAINLGVGVYQDEAGKTATLECVKRAEAKLLAAGAPKTYLAIDLAISVAAGRAFLGTYPVHSGPVLLVDCELHPNTLAKRLAAANRLAEAADEIERLRADMEKRHGVKVEFEHADLMKTAEVESLVARLVARHGFVEKELLFLFSRVKRREPILQAIRPPEPDVAFPVTLPPLASIFDFADALKAWAATVSFFVSSPSPRIFTRSTGPLARPALRMTDAVPPSLRVRMAHSATVLVSHHSLAGRITSPFWSSGTKPCCWPLTPMA